MARLQRTVGNRAAAALLSTGRDPELRLARSTAEQAFAFAHEGQVESTQIFAGGVPQESETDVDEFVLWNFLVNDTTVRKGHKEKLDPVAQRWAAELAADPRLRVRVLGYASVTGGAVLNDDLARRRAESVRDHLVGLGLSEDQIVIDSSGSRLPMDEGTSPQSLARNRRVEVSKFVATTMKSSLSDLGPGIDIRVQSLDIQGSAGIKQRVTDDAVIFTFGDAPTVLRATVKVASADPDVDVGFLQFVTSDARRGGYSDTGADGEVLDFHVPPTTAIDYDHCMNAFGPSRDVRFARLPFSREGAGRVARPAPQSAAVSFDDRREAVFPHKLQISRGRRGVLTQMLGTMSFKILLVARKGESIVPLDQAEWELSAAVKMILGPAPKVLSKSVTAVSQIDSRSGFLATRPFPDVDRAMSLPTSTLRERMMNQLCKPTLTPVTAGLGPDFDDAINGGEEALRKARRLALPD